MRAAREGAVNHIVDDLWLGTVSLITPKFFFLRCLRFNANLTISQNVFHFLLNLKNDLDNLPKFIFILHAKGDDGD